MNASTARLRRWALPAALAMACLPAWSLTMPISFVGVGCGTTADSGWTSVGPAGGTFALNCDRTGTSTWPFPGGSWQSVAQALTGYQVSDQGVATGVADAAANVEVSGVLRDSARAGAQASIQYQVAFERLAAPPFEPPTIAIQFSASGEATISGADGWFFDIGSSLAVADFPYAEFQRQSNFGPMSGSFSSTATLWVVPGSTTLASVHALCNFTRTDAGSGECQANADPVIGFDQAAFDALYGPLSFDLASAYRIAFSPAVPEVPTVWLWLLAVPLLAATRRRNAPACG